MKVSILIWWSIQKPWTFSKIVLYLDRFAKKCVFFKVYTLRTLHLRYSFRSRACNIGYKSIPFLYIDLFQGLSWNFHMWELSDFRSTSHGGCCQLECFLFTYKLLDQWLWSSRIMFGEAIWTQLNLSKPNRDYLLQKSGDPDARARAKPPKSSKFHLAIFRFPEQENRRPCHRHPTCTSYWQARSKHETNDDDNNNTTIPLDWSNCSVLVEQNCCQRVTVTVKVRPERPPLILTARVDRVTADKLEQKGARWRIWIQNALKILRLLFFVAPFVEIFSPC